MSGGRATAFVALGSNLGPRATIFERAISLIDGEPRVWVVARSDWLETAPLGPRQPSYLNGVVRIETTLAPEVLLALLHAVESLLGRRRSKLRWGPRVIDLDLIAYGRRSIMRPGLVLPHPGRGRSFVRIPLQQVGGDSG